MKKFIGRTAELQSLTDLFEQKSVSLAVIKGRRRVGKSRLVVEFAKEKRFLSFTGLAPVEGVTVQTQLNHFGQQLALQLNIPVLTFIDWTNALASLAHYIDDRGTVILFDEISWMGAKDPAFVSKLKAWWDTIMQQKTHVLLVFCSSVSTWIEKNILNSTAFFGRISLTITLEPLSIPNSVRFLKAMGYKGSTFEIYKILSVIGGIPWYLEHIKPNMTADANIKNLCFKKDGLLVLEFERIFHDLFKKRSHDYKIILGTLNTGMKTLAEIQVNLGSDNSSVVRKKLTDLITCNFVSKNYQWSPKTETISKRSLYRICDPYMRFYLKSIEPNRLRIDQGTYENLELAQIPGIDSHIGLQVEQLLLQNRTLLLKAIGVPAGECLFDGPYIQTKTNRTKGCQVDYMLQTRTKNIFVCEFKFKRSELGPEIITEMQDKMARLSVPRGYAAIPVLFHIGGVSESVYDKQFFYRIIDIADLVEM